MAVDRGTQRGRAAGRPDSEGGDQGRARTVEQCSVEGATVAVHLVDDRHDHSRRPFELLGHEDGVLHGDDVVAEDRRRRSLTAGLASTHRTCPSRRALTNADETRRG